MSMRNDSGPLSRRVHRAQGEALAEPRTNCVAIKRFEPAQWASEQRNGCFDGGCCFSRNICRPRRGLFVSWAMLITVPPRFTLGFMLSPALRAVESQRFTGLLKLALLVFVTLLSANATSPKVEAAQLLRVPSPSPPDPTR